MEATEVQRTKLAISMLALTGSLGWAAPAAARDEAQSASPDAQTSETATGILWDGAPEFEGEGGWTLKPSGRLQYDFGFIDAPDSTGRPEGSGDEVRRARLGIEGSVPGGFGFKAEVDFAPDTVELNDAILTYSDGPATVSLGQHNNFQSLEELTSSRFTSMIERAAFTDAFGFERRLGISLQYAAGPILAQAGAFGDNVHDLSSKNRGVDGRLVFMPKIGNAQVHLGGSIHYADLESGSTVRYRQRPLVHFTSQRFIDTGSLGANSESGFGLEAAVVSGRLHAAAEQYWQHLSRPGALSDPTFSGGYAEVGYFLTRGDTRGYRKGKFDRVEPKRQLGRVGMGAVQVNLRYDWLDLVDAGIVGGKQAGYLASLVWTPTNYTRLLVNYGRLHYDNAIYPAAGGDRSYGVDAFGVRAQIDF